MTSVAQNSGPWICGSCTLVNGAGTKVCSACNLPPTAKGLWACTDCTYHNTDDSIACEMCYRTRISAKDRSYQWEWSPEPDHWIAFDLPSTTDLETAFQSHKATITLRRGPFFSTQSDRYIVHMDYTNRNHYQLNNSSGNRRLVRRRTAEGSMVDISVEEVDENDRCVICQDGFEGGEGREKGREIVRLKECVGHYFHKECIGGYVMLRGSCPVCFKKVEV